MYTLYFCQTLLLIMSNVNPLTHKDQKELSNLKGWQNSLIRSLGDVYFHEIFLVFKWGLKPHTDLCTQDFCFLLSSSSLMFSNPFLTKSVLTTQGHTAITRTLSVFHVLQFESPRPLKHKKDKDKIINGKGSRVHIKTQGYV